MPDTPRAINGLRGPRHDDTDKGAVERAVFTEFVARYRADIDITSIRSGDPLRREPDILAKSTEGHSLVAFELVRLTDTASVVTVEAFARKFQKAQQGLYAGVDADSLELLAWSERLLTPWEDVLALVAGHMPLDTWGFTRAWLWNRPDDDAEDGVWLWEAGLGLSRFD